MSKNSSIIMTILVMFLSSSCELIDQGPEIEPILTNYKSSEIRVYYTDATLSATIRDYDDVTNVGFVYGTDENNLDSWIEGTMSDGTITASLKGLKSGKKYWYCSAAKTKRNTYYAKNTYSFITFPDGPVDLNLPSGLKWANRNVGAEYPTDPGEYYAWGETTTKNYYDWSQYKFWNGDKNVTVSSMTKYGNDGKTVLDPEDDIAHVAWGGNWRMPDALEIDELFQYCHFSNVTINDVKGYKLISKKDMNEELFIFFPRTGYIKDASITSSTISYFWSRTTYPYQYSPEAYSANISSVGGSLNGPNRYVGIPVRPVCE